MAKQAGPDDKQSAPRKRRRRQPTGMDTEPSRQSLDELPLRVLRFLRGVSSSNEIASILVQRGYGAREHEEGWELLRKSFPFIEPVDRSRAGAQAATLEVQRWHDTTLRIARASLKRRFPAYAGLLGAEAPSLAQDADVAAILDRLDQLERQASAKPVLDLLATRGITKEVRRQIREVVRTAQGLELGRPVSGAFGKQEQSRKAARAELLALHGYFAEWSEIARTDIKRGDLLVRLGLASRKRGGVGEHGGSTRPPSKVFYRRLHVESPHSAGRKHMFYRQSRRLARCVPRRQYAIARELTRPQRSRWCLAAGQASPARPPKHPRACIPVVGARVAG